MSKYNENLITSFNENKYQEILSDYDKLLNHYQISLNRYNKSDNPKPEGEYLLILESIDHYVTKRFLTEASYRESQEFKNYIRFLKEANLSKSAYIFNNNFLNNIDDATLIELLGKDRLEKIKLCKYRGQEKVKKIMEKIHQNEQITQDELNIACDYYNLNRDPNTNEHETLVRYIFDNLTKENSELIGSKYVSEAVLSFLPKYFKYSDSEDATEIRTTLSKNHVFIAGSSDNHIVLLNYDRFKDIDFKHSDDIARSFSTTGNDFTYLLFIAFHEIFHQDQFHLSKKTDFSDYGYSFILSDILENEYHAYKRNHDNDEIEIDASERSWIECIKFYNDFIKDEQLRKKLIDSCTKNAIETSYRRSFAAKKDEDNKIIDADIYDIEKLSKIIKEKPTYLEKYPMLRTFYTKNGSLNLQFITDPRIKDTIIGEKYVRYACLRYPTKLLEIITKANGQKIKTSVYNLCRTASDEMQRKEKSLLAQKDKASIEYKINELPEFIKNRNTRIIVRNCLKILIKPAILIRHPIKISKLVTEVIEKIDDLSDHKQSIKK